MAVVLVTGGTRGIGAACVEWFLANGDQVATTFRSADPPPAPQGSDPDRFLAVRCDVRDSDEVDAAFASIEERWGPVEVLVANAGITKDSLMLRMSEAAFHDVIDANLTGLVPGRQAGRGQDAAPAHGPHHLRLVGRGLRRASRAGELRRVQGRPGRAWPAPSPGRWAAARSR